jgi:hypothetical protein
LKEYEASIPVVCKYCHNANSRDDIKCADNCGSLDAYNKAVAIAIDSCNKEWVEWLESNLFHETDYGLEFNCLSKFALGDWQERKKEIGL